MGARRGTFLLAALVAIGSARTAHADAGALDAKVVAYSYEIENADIDREKVLVLWPRNCGSYGDPLGKINLAINPDWALRQNEIDYEVVVNGKRHELLEQCKGHARFYALSAGAFPLATRTATADDTAIGQEAGVPFAIVPSLDAITLEKRIDFLAKDPRVLRAEFRFEPVRTVRLSSPLKRVHDVLAVHGFGATTFSVVPKSAVYTYEDGAIETVAYLGAQRGPPARGGLEDDAGATANAGADAGGEVGAGASASTDVPPKGDLGTRWVFLAAIGGLVVGGLLAVVRRKKARAEQAK